MKKILLLSIMMLLPMLANAAVEIDGIYYNLISGNEAEVTENPNKYSGSVVIPQSFVYGGKTYSVTSIGNYAFLNSIRLTSLTIPNSVTSIGEDAFGSCHGLTSLSIPISVTTIGNYAFSGCSGLTSVTIGDNVTFIGEGAFYDCDGLTSVTIPNSVTSIGQGAFRSCSGLTSIKVESGNPNYDSRNNCNAIIETSLNTLIAGCKNTIITNSVTSIGKYAFYGCSGLTSVTIPNSVTSIGKWTFSYCDGLTSVTIPNSVTSIGQSAFSGCSGLISIKVESGNPKYDSRNNCNAIIETSSNILIVGCKNTIIPNSVTSIGNDAFSDCRGLTSVTIPNSVTSIGEHAFSQCDGLTSLTIPNSVTSIGNYAFYNCIGLTSVTIPNSITSIGECTFSHCDGLTSLTIPNSVTSIGNYAFYNCRGLTSMTIPNSVTFIDAYAFEYCRSLTSVKSEIQNPFSINDNVFQDISSNAILQVPKGTKSKYEAFSGWTKHFKEIVESEGGDTSTKRTIHVATAGTLPNLIPESEKYIIEELTLTGELNGTDFRLLRDMAGCNYLGEETAGKLKVLDLTGANIFAGGEKYIDTDNLPNWGPLYCSVQKNNFLPHHVFHGCKLNTILIPNSVTSIGSYVFSGCSGLTSLKISNSVTGISDDAFLNCSGLTSIKVDSNNRKYDSRNNCNAIIETSSNTLITGCKSTLIPSSVTNIGNYAFLGCSGLTSLTIPNSVTSIGKYAFYGCSGLTSLTISNSVTSIGSSVFSVCSGLTSITIPNSVTSIGTCAFSGCSGLTSLTIPNSVTSIGNYAFSGCSGLTSIMIPNSVTSIGSYVFSGCSGLTSLKISNSMTTIGSYAFFNCSGLTSITIPNSVKSIGRFAFSCSGLTSVISEIKNPFEITDDVFSTNTYSKATLTVPNGSKAKYQSTRFWNKFSKIEEDSGGDTSTKRTIHVATAGTLPNYISESEKYNIEELTLTGELNGTDFRLLRDMAGNNYLGQETEGRLTVLDLSNVTIVAGGEKYLDTNTINTYVRRLSGNFHYSISYNNQLPDNAFCGCHLKIVNIPNSVTSIGNCAFEDCSVLTSVTIPNSVISIGFEAFMGCSGLITIKVESGNPKYDSRNNCNAIIETSSNTLIMGCNNTIIPSSVTSIGLGAFYCCSGLISVTIPNSVTSIGKLAFSGCKGLTSLTISNSVTSIGGSAFYGCSGLPSVTIPNSVTSIGSGAFFGCSGLTSVKSEIQNPFEIDGYVFGGIPSNAILQVPKGTKYKYEVFSGWTKNFTEIRESNEGQSTTTYTLSITATGNGSASYDGTTIRGKTSSFTLNEGTNATITFTPDDGYRIKTVIVNNSTVSVSYNQYTVSNISMNTVVEVEFEAIPPTTYTLSIKATGNGSASYNGTTIRGRTSSFTLNEGTNATITFTPDNGYRIKTVKVNNTTVSVSNNQYTVSNISRNTTVEIEFEAIPATTYTLSITATGNGSASYNGTTIRSKTSSFTINEGTNATITFTPDNGYRIKTVKVNNTTVSVSNNQYTVSNISRNTTVEVEFEAIPPTTYTLSVKATGNGSASYNGTTIRGRTSSFTLNEGTNATITFTPDNGYRIKTVNVNNSIVSVSNNQYTVSNISRNTTVEVEFEEEIKAFAVNGVNYSVISDSEKTVVVAKGDYGTVIVWDIPAKVTYKDTEWTVSGIEDGTLANSPDLCAIIWNPEAAFTESVSNPNLLLYVKAASYAPSTVKNVVVNGTAETITLKDAASGNDFYCPQDFTAKSISYTHHYTMETGMGEPRGWETIALPFDVQKIEHQSKGEIIPYAAWKSGDAMKPFWLMEFSYNGWTDVNGIKACTPYIISMPNHAKYKEEYKLNGNVTFSAENVKIGKTNNLSMPSYNGRTFIPSFNLQKDRGHYALNVNNDFIVYNGNIPKGSLFYPDLREIHPFEAYMTTTSGARSIAISDDMMTTGIREIMEMLVEQKGVRVYNLKGQLIKVDEAKSIDEVIKALPSGVYIVNGQKLIIK